MSYTHRGREPVFSRKDPIDPDSTEWFYFAWGDWLETDEVITLASSVVTGGIQEGEMVYLASRTDDDGTVYSHIYAIQVSVTTGATRLSITCRVSTNLGRLNIDRTVIVPVRSL